MEKKVLLILVDGMRPDSLSLCEHTYISTLLQNSSYTLCAKTVMPSATLPCHMSLFQSVEPTRHGVITNTFTPQVAPIDGLFEQIRHFGGKTAMFYDWEELRDISRPGSLCFSCMASPQDNEGGLHKTLQITKRTLFEYLPKENPDFVFYYIGLPDGIGHTYGWMGEEYLSSIRESFDNIEQIINILPKEYRVLITADHGGHNRTHGTDLKEDMTIPLICNGAEFPAGHILPQISILDIAPTITKILGIPQNQNWNGKSFL